jgi:hypothetical protein
MNKKILVICNLEHASPRMPGLLNSLANFDWEITILTPKLPNHFPSLLGFPFNFENKVKIIETKNPGDVFSILRIILFRLGLKRNLSLVEQIKSNFPNEASTQVINNFFRLLLTFIAFPDTERKWKKYAINSAREILKSQRFDLILSSSPFPTSHVVASKLSCDFGVLWVADFRDTWTGNPVYPFGKIRKKFEQIYESKIMKRASLFLTVSDEYSKTLSNLHNKEIEVIPNGFVDYQDFEFINFNFDKFTIIYTGNIYFPQQNPYLLFQALNRLFEKNQVERNKIEIRFYGRFESKISELVREFGLEDVVLQCGRVDRLESIRLQRSADALLFLGWNEENAAGLSHLKFYEYLSAGVPILHIGPKSTIYSNIISKTGLGVTLNSVESIMNEINLVLSAKESNLLLSRDINPSIEEYSYNHYGKILNSHLTKLFSPRL